MGIPSPAAPLTAHWASEQLTNWQNSPFHLWTSLPLENSLWCQVAFYHSISSSHRSRFYPYPAEWDREHGAAWSITQKTNLLHMIIPHYWSIDIFSSVAFHKSKWEKVALLVLCLCAHSPEYSWIQSSLMCPCLYLPSNMGKPKEVVHGAIKIVCLFAASQLWESHTDMESIILLIQQLFCCQEDQCYKLPFKPYSNFLLISLILLL